MRLAQFLKLSRIEDHEYFNNLTVLYLYIGEEYSNQHHYCCNIDNELLNNIANRLSECIFLQQFIFQHGFIGATNQLEYKILFEALQHIEGLKKFDIAFNFVGCLNDKGLQALAAYIAASNLEHINFNENDLHRLSYDNLNILLNSLMACNSLRSICLSNNHLHEVAEEKFDLICNFIKNKNPHLDYIELRHDNITSDRKEKLNKAFQKVKNTELILSAPIPIAKSMSNREDKSIPNTPPKCFL